MKKLLLIAILALVAYYVGQTHKNPTIAPTATAEAIQDGSALLQAAYQNQQSDLQVQGAGQVSRILPDDNKGSRHQKFLLRLATGQTILIAHNIDLAQRIGGLQEGDTVEFFGEYEWNDKGGVVHWTHHDPGGRHTDGWLKHNGTLYQ
ncbi:DUF3465 domain-containing protein [Pseudaeromonas paramecii]|uniref:DUF3465 domain-containing protein n=1 Tax=Pseudaeromonas paramecii TaxID=2138166 RepID=A0ABP8PW44_9GAMM